jgi:hypothetical protein
MAAAAACMLVAVSGTVLAAPQGETEPQAEELAQAEELTQAEEPAQPEEESARSFSIGGLLFGDVYGVTSHHLPDAEGSFGAWIRRGYLTFDTDLSERWFGRVRFELNQSGEFESYSFEVDFKDLYLGVKIREQRLLFGLSPSRTFDLVEQIWGFRYLERTPLDLQGVASRDIGISAEGPLNKSGSLRYRAMIGSGIEFGNESGDGRKVMFAFTWLPSAAWIVDLYADYERLEGPADRSTLQAFLAYKVEKGRIGILYSNQYREEDPPLEVASVFVVRKLTESVSLVGRVDRLFEPSPRGNDIDYLPFDPTARATLFLGGVELRAYRGLRMTPNAEVIAYDRNDAGKRPATDVVLRLTLFYER